MTAPDIAQPVCTQDGCGKSIFNKTLGLCQTHYMAHRRAAKKAGQSTKLSGGRQGRPTRGAAFVIPPEIIENMSKARTTEDWQNLGQAIAPIMASIMAGNTNANAAQVSLIKDIMNRAYGKPVATQADKKVSSGIVFLPSIGPKADSLICPICAFDALNLVQDDSTRELGLKILRELLDRIIADNSKKSEVTLDS